MSEKPALTGAPIMERVLETITALQKAQQLNNQLQEKFAVGSSEWHACESIDDQLHEALVHLGE